MIYSKLYAAIAGVIFPGLGHFYHKRYVSTFIFMVLYFLLYPLGFYLLLPVLDSTVMLGFLTTLALFHLLSAVFAYRLTPNTTHPWYVVIGFFLLSSALYTLIDYAAPFENFTIPSRSMENTLHIGDQVTVIKTKEIVRDNVIVFEKEDGVFFIKRCIAVGGDKITLLNKHVYLHPHEGDAFLKAHYPKHTLVNLEGMLWVKDPSKNKHATILHDNSVRNTQHIQRKRIFDMEILTVAKNHYFVLGDNRDHSNDSRFIGSIPKEHIFGKASIIYLNYGDFSRVGKRIK